MTKHCPRCESVRPVVDFYVISATGRPASWCKDCTKIQASRRFQANKGAILARKRELYAASPETRVKYQKQARRWRDRNPEAAREHDRKKRQQKPVVYAWSDIQDSARSRNLEFSLPRALFDDLVTDNCFYCGATPDPVNGVDRVDNERGYVEDNVVTCCKHCNRSKHTRTRADFETWILRAAEHLRRAPAAQAA